MPDVQISWLEGRTIEQKRVLVERITAAMQEIGVQPTSLTIRIADFSKENWASNGVLFSDRPTT